jgi:hypothetical protein
VVTVESVEMVFADQVDTGDQPAQAAAALGIQLEVVKLPEAKKGFMQLPRAGSSSAVSPGRLLKRFVELLT